MITLSEIENQLKEALKARDHIAADALRGLKTRLQNERIAKGRELSGEDVTALIRSEVKRRMEAARAFSDGGRKELADKELLEAKILEKFLPPQMSEAQISEAADKVIAEGSFTAKDFGAAMGKLKALVGSSADGGSLARVLKEKLK